MKYLIYSVFLCGLLICNGLSYAIESKPWTFLVYLAAVNNLNEYAYADLAEMMKVGSNNNVNVIVYLSILQDNGSEVTVRLYVEKGQVIQVSPPDSEDSGSVTTLKKALSWALNDYPSDHIAVVLWDHGSGILNRMQRLTMRGICYDDITNNFLTDRDLLNAFSWAQKTYRAGKKFDIIACDACLMAMVEMAYTLANCTTYFVASQETIPDDGYDYARVLTSFTKSVPQPFTLAQTIVSAYQAEYMGTPDYTLSAIDTSKLNPLVSNMRQIASSIMTILKGNKASTMRSYLSRSYNRALKFNSGLYCDMNTFFSTLRSFLPKMGLAKKDMTMLDSLLANNSALIKQCVPSKVSSTYYKDACGLSFYFPPYNIDSSYVDLYWTEKNPFMLQLLESYLQ